MMWELTYTCTFSDEWKGIRGVHVLPAELLH